MKITDYTKDGSCSGCGACCTNYLPTTKRELSILRRWIKKNNFKPSSSEDLDIDSVLTANTDAEVAAHVIDATCPFLDKKTQKCVCYDVRPTICKIFSCNSALVKVPINSKMIGARIRNLRRELFKQPTPSYEEFSMLINYIAAHKKAGEAGES